MSQTLQRHMPDDTGGRGAPETTLRLTAVRYHRNGSAGEGFFLVAFRWREGHSWRALTATVTPEGDEWPRSRVAVFDPHSVSECFDGFWFAPVLIAWCRNASEDGSAHR